jgi:hypothetical protein
MPNWLQKIPLPPSLSKKKDLPTLRQNGGLMPSNPYDERPSTLPSASVIYGVAASAMFVMALYLMVNGHLLTGFLVVLPGVALLGFALHYLKHR